MEGVVDKKRLMWNCGLASALVRVWKIPFDEAFKRASDSAWDIYYDDGYKPMEAAREDASYAG